MQARHYSHSLIVSNGLRNSLVTAGMIALFLASAEAVLHSMRKLRPLPRTYVGEYTNRRRRDLVPDAVLGWRYHALGSFGTAIKYRSNSTGFRSNREFLDSSRTPKHLIVLAGDSFTFGFGVEYSKTFGAVVESRLRDSFVYNFGVTGFGLDQIWLALRTEALPLKPSLAIVTFISGDFTRTEEAYRPWEGFTKPTFTLENGALRPQTPEDIPGPVLRFFDRHSSFWRAGRLALRTAAHHYPLGEWWHLNEAVLDRIRADCAAARVPLVFVYIPTKEWGHFPTLRDYVRRTQSNLIDMAEPSRLPSQGTTLPDGHPNARGHRFIAEAILAWITQNLPLLNANY